MILRVLDGQETGAQWTLNGPLSCQRVLAASRSPGPGGRGGSGPPGAPFTPSTPARDFFEFFRPDGGTQTRLSSRRITGRYTETGFRSPTPLGVFFGARGWSIYTSMCGMLRRTECRIDRRTYRCVTLSWRAATRTGWTSSALGSLDPRPFERSAIGALTSNRLSANGSPSAVRSSELA